MSNSSPWSTPSRAFSPQGLEDRLNALPFGDGVLSTGPAEHLTRLVRLSANERMTVEEGRHDLFVLTGGLRLDGRDLAAGAYVAMDGGSDLTAGEAGVTLFHFRKRHAGPASRTIVNPGNRVWRTGIIPGVRRCDLRVSDHEVALVTFDPATRIRPHRHHRGEEIYVLAGALHGAPMRLGPGEWHRLDPHAIHAPRAMEATMILLLTGHLSSEGFGARSAHPPTPRDPDPL